MIALLESSTFFDSSAPPKSTCLSNLVLRIIYVFCLALPKPDLLFFLCGYLQVFKQQY